MGNLFSKEKKEKEPKEFILPEYGKEAKEKLVELFVEYLKPFWYEDNFIPGLTLYLHGHKDAWQISLLTDNAEFREYLLNECREKSINVEDDFKWEVKLEKPQSNKAKEFRKGIYLKEEESTPPIIPKIAKIIVTLP